MTREINPDTSSYLDWSDKGKSGVGRYLGGLTLATLALFLSVGSLAPLVLGPDQQNSLLPSTLADLLSFAVVFLAIPLIVRLIHQRPSLERCDGQAADRMAGLRDRLRRRCSGLRARSPHLQSRRSHAGRVEPGVRMGPVVGACPPRVRGRVRPGRQ